MKNITGAQGAFIARLLIEAYQSKGQRILEAGYTGQKKDKLGHTRYYANGRQVKNPNAKEKSAIHAAASTSLPAGQSPSSNDAATRVDALHADTPPEHVAALANDLMKMSVEDLAKMAKAPAEEEPKQKRANAGGEVGPNGEHYKGGAFIATTEMPKRLVDKFKRAAGNGVEAVIDFKTRNRTLEKAPSPDMMSISGTMMGTWMGPDGDVQHQPLDYYQASAEKRRQVAELAEKYKAGVKWVPINDYPDVALGKHVYQLAAAGLPIAGSLLDRLGHNADFQKYYKKQTEKAAATAAPAPTPEPEAPAATAPPTPTAGMSADANALDALRLKSNKKQHNPAHINPEALSSLKAQGFIDEANKLTPAGRTHLYAEKLKGAPAPTGTAAASPAAPKPKWKRANRNKDSLISIVKRKGGINSKSLKTDYDYQADIIEGGLLHAIRKQGMGLDEMAQSLQVEGHIIVPEGVDPGDYLLDRMKGRHHSALRNTDKEIESEQEAFYKAQHEAKQGGHDERSIEGSRRSGAQTGESAGEKEGATELDEWDNSGAGETGSGEKDATVSGDGYDSADANDYDRNASSGEVDNSFDFGANADEKPKADEDSDQDESQEQDDFNRIVLGKTFKDKQGNEYLAHSKRHGKVTAFPIVDGKPVVNNQSAKYFAVTKLAKLQNAGNDNFDHNLTADDFNADEPAPAPAPAATAAAPPPDDAVARHMQRQAFTGIDSQGREWQNGELVAAKDDEPAPAGKAEPEPEPKAAPEPEKKSNKFENPGDVITPSSQSRTGENPLEVVSIKDGWAVVGYANRPDGPRVRMPSESLDLFRQDQQGRVDLPDHTGSEAIDNISNGKGKLLGSGDDGFAYDAGDKVVKVSTTAPFHAFGHEHRAPAEAVHRLKGQAEINNDMIKAGVPGLLPQTFEEHGNRGFITMEKLDTTTKLTPEQVDEVARNLEAMHKLGYVLGDQIQVGIDFAGHPKIFDTGKAVKAGSGGYSKEDHIDYDNSNLERFFKDNGLTYEDPEQKKLTKLRDSTRAQIEKIKAAPKDIDQGKAQFLLHSFSLHLNLLAHQTGGVLYAYAMADDPDVKKLELIARHTIDTDSFHDKTVKKLKPMDAPAPAAAAPDQPGFTGTDAQGREWQDGKLVAAKDDGEVMPWSKLPEPLTQAVPKPPTPSQPATGEPLTFDRDTNTHNGIKLRRGDYLTGPDGQSYRLDRDQGNMLSIDKIKNGRVVDTLGVSTDPTSKDYFPLKHTGTNYYDQSAAAPAGKAEPEPEPAAATAAPAPAAPAPDPDPDDDRSMPEHEAVRQVYLLDLPKTTTDQVLRRLNTNLQWRRKTGKISGSNAYTQYDIKLALEEVLTQKQENKQFKKNLDQALQSQKPNLQPLIQERDDELAVLTQAKEKKGYYGVRSGEDHVRRMIANSKIKIMNLNQKIIDLAAKAPAAAAPEPEPVTEPSTPVAPAPMDEETYLATNGASRQDIGEPALHRQPRAKPNQIEKNANRQLEKDYELTGRRDDLRKEYADKVASGEIRPPTRTEKLIQSANGHEDNESTQAARRMLQKSGIDWNQPAPPPSPGEADTPPAAKWTAKPPRANKNDTWGRSDFNDKGELITGSIAGIPITANYQRTFDGISDQTKAALEKEFSDPKIIAALKDAGIKNLHMMEDNSNAMRPKWTMAHSQGSLLFNRLTAQRIKKNDAIRARQKDPLKPRGLRGVIFHEAGHGLYGKAGKDLRNKFQAALAKHPEVKDFIASKQSIKAPMERFDDMTPKEYEGREVHAEVYAIKDFDPERFESFPEEIKQVVNEIEEKGRTPGPDEDNSTSPPPASPGEANTLPPPIPDEADTPPAAVTKSKSSAEMVKDILKSLGRPVKSDAEKKLEKLEQQRVDLNKQGANSRSSIVSKQRKRIDLDERIQRLRAQTQNSKKTTTEAVMPATDPHAEKIKLIQAIIARRGITPPQPKAQAKKIPEASEDADPRVKRIRELMDAYC